MSGMDAAERLIALVRENSDIAHHADGCGAKDIDAAENILGITFPRSYRRVIEEFGTWDIAGEEFLGLYQTPAMGSQFLGSVKETLDARQRYGMPVELLAVMFDGMGGIVVLDSSRPGWDGEYPVVAWDPGVVGRQCVERLGEDFGSFAIATCEAAVARWRRSG